MELRRDERAVTVQIGAVLLLAIVFTALALYQVNVVPAENSAVEYEHNRQVHGEMHELRNAIKNVGTSGGSESVSITLGTQYPTRTFSMNPSAPSGTLETREMGPVRIDNAEINGTYTGNPNALVGADHETRTLVYEPSYNEYRNAPTTRIEHGLAYNDFDDAAVPLTEQPLVVRDEITLVLVDGELSTTSSRTTSVDVRLLTGPTDPINLESSGSNNITITIPTQSPDAWNETIGTEFDSGAENARVVPSSGRNGQLTIELAEGGEPYNLQMACVAVGDSNNACDDLNISKVDNSEAGTTLAGPEVTSLTLDSNTVTQGDQIGVTAEFNNRGTRDDLRGGTPIVAAEWYIVGTDQSGTLSSQDFNSSLELQANGTIPTSDLETNTTYTVGVRAQDTRGVWTNESIDSPTAEFTVDDASAIPGGLEYTGTARTSEGSEPGTDSQVAFDLENTGTESITVEGVEVDASGPADRIRSDDFWPPEIWVQSTDNGFAWQFENDGYSLGDRIDLDDPATVESGQGATITLTEFQQQRNTYVPIDMNGRTVTVTVYYQYSDGTTAEETVTFTPT